MSSPYPDYETQSKKSMFTLTGSLKDKVENKYEPSDFGCLCPSDTDTYHAAWCVYGEEQVEAGVTREQLITIDGWRLVKVTYDKNIYGGLCIPDLYEFSHPCPVALWRMTLDKDDNNKVFPCRACCQMVPDSLMAVYVLHKGTP